MSGPLAPPSSGKAPPLFRPALQQPPAPMSASPKPKLVPADPALWRKAFLDLRPNVSPCPGLTGANWAATHENAVTFLD